MSDSSRSEFWIAHINRQQTSGLSVKAYALANGLNPQSLYTWRSSLNKKPSKNTSKPRPSVTFAKVVGIEESEHLAVMRILDAGVMIEFDNAPSPEWLHRFLQLRSART